MESRILGAIALLTAAACSDAPATLRPDLGSLPPEIIRFAASSTTAEEGEQVFLAWETQGATEVDLLANAVDPLLLASRRASGVEPTVPLIVDTRFTLVARGPTGEVRQELAIDVVPSTEGDMPPRITRFRVSPEVFQGRSRLVRLTYTASGELQLTANGAPVPGFDGSGFAGLDVEVDASRTVFELMASRGGQTVTATVAVTRDPSEREPNESPSDANVPSAGVGRGELTEGDRDLWVIEVPALGRVFAEVSDRLGRCPFDSNLVLFRYRPEVDGPDALEVVTQNDDLSPTSRCSRIDPTTDGAAAGLAEGLYILAVESRGEGEIGDYELLIDIDVAACGNGSIEFAAGEACDDGNTTAGDGCSATCEVEALDELADRDEALLDLLETSEGQTRFAAVELSAAGVIDASLTPCTPGTLDLVSAETLDGVDYLLLAEADDACRIAPRRLPAGRYYVRARGPLPASSQLDVFSALLGCGDRLVDDGEECDDGDTADGDGCSSTCTFEPTESVVGVRGDISLSVPAEGDGSAVVGLRISGATGSVRVTPKSPCSGPLRITLVDPLFQVVGSVEDQAECPALEPQQVEFARELPSGLYHVVFASPGAANNVTYDFSDVGPFCGNGVLERSDGEQCEVGDFNCVGCQRQTRATVDCTDTVSFESQPALAAGEEAFFRVRPTVQSGILAVSTRIPSPAFGVPDPALNTQVFVEVYDQLGNLLQRGGGTPVSPFTNFTVFVSRFSQDSPPGEFEVRLFRENDFGGIPSFDLEVNCPESRCGNLFRELGEQCDDGNTFDDDGCSSRCQFEEPNIAEQEDPLFGRNDRRDRAKPLGLTIGVNQVPVVGQVIPVGDVDTYSFEIPDGRSASVRAFLNSRASAQISCTADARGRLSLLDGGGNLIVSRGDGTDCPRIDGISGGDLRARRLPAGRYFVRFDRPQGGQSSVYTLFVQLDD